MKKIIAALTALIMISCFATAANAQDYHTVGDTDNSKSAPDSADLEKGFARRRDKQNLQ